MSVDAAATRGRQTRGKWKRAAALFGLALLTLLGGWLSVRPETIQNGVAAVKLRLMPHSEDTWQALAWNGTAYAGAGDTLFCAGDGYLSAVDLSGNLRWQQEADLKNPMIRTCGGYAAIYDPGGLTLYLADRDGLRACTVPRGIDGAAVGPQGQTAAITTDSGFLTETVCFDPIGERLQTIGLTGCAMVMMDYLSDGTLVSCCISTLGRWTLRYDSGDRHWEVPLETDLVYDLRCCGSGVALWTSNGILFYDRAGTRTGIYPLDGEAVQAWACDGCAAVILRHNGAWLTVVTPEGAASEAVPLPERPTVLTVCDKTVCILDSGTLLVYDDNGILQERVAPGICASEMIPVPGGVLLLGEGGLMFHPLS